MIEDDLIEWMEDQLEINVGIITAMEQMLKWDTIIHIFLALGIISLGIAVMIS